MKPKRDEDANVAREAVAGMVGDTIGFGGGIRETLAGLFGGRPMREVIGVDNAEICSGGRSTFLGTGGFGAEGRV